MERGEKIMMEPYFWRADDVAEILQCSISKAHKLMAQWNKELNARGFVTMQGRVPRQYAMDRLGVDARAVEEKSSPRVVDIIDRKRRAYA